MLCLSFLSKPAVKCTWQSLRESGWQKGTSSLVRFAPITPATALVCVLCGLCPYALILCQLSDTTLCRHNETYQTKQSSRTDGSGEDGPLLPKHLLAALLLHLQERRHGLHCMYTYIKPIISFHSATSYQHPQHPFNNHHRQTTAYRRREHHPAARPRFPLGHCLVPHVHHGRLPRARVHVRKRRKRGGPRAEEAGPLLWLLWLLRVRGACWAGGRSSLWGLGGE